MRVSIVKVLSSVKNGNNNANEWPRNSLPKYIVKNRVERAEPKPAAGAQRCRKPGNNNSNNKRF